MLPLVAPIQEPRSTFAFIEKYKRKSSALNLGFGYLYSRLKRNVPKLTSGHMDKVLKTFIDVLEEDYFKASVILQIPQKSNNRIGNIAEMVLIFKEVNNFIKILPVAVRFRDGTINPSNPISKHSVEQAS